MKTPAGFVASISSPIRGGKTNHVVCRSPRSFRPSCAPFLACAALSSTFFSAFAPATAAAAEADGGRCASAGRKPTMAAPSSLKELSGLTAIDGSDLPASRFDGKVTLAVNVASACGYTDSGYETMREIGEEFSPDVVVVAIPCNAFGMQESGTPEQIKAFATDKYKNVVITERIEENPVSHPIFAVGAAKFPGPVSWNFDGKYLFDKNGEPVNRFDNSASTADIRAAIKELL